MTTTNDRITRLEDAFVNQQELNREMVGLLREHGELLRTIAKTQEEHSAILTEHTGLLKSIVSTLQGHSADLTLIREHLG